MSQKSLTFKLIFSFYFCMYFCLGAIPSNIESLMTDFSAFAQFGVGMIIVSSLIMNTISMLAFGYFSEYLSEKITRKRLFLLTNTVWIVPFGVVGFSTSYGMFISLTIIAAIGIGAFLPIGFSIIGDLYETEQRGGKFGMMMLGQFLGNGIGILIGGVVGWRITFVIGSVLGCIAFFGFMSYGTGGSRDIRPEVTREKNRYNISYRDIVQLAKTKTVLGILLFVFCSGIATSVLSNWALFNLSLKFSNKGYATLLYLIVGIGAMPGAVMGGQFGDIISRSHPNGRIYISVGGIIAGTIMLSIFYIYPFILCGILGYFFVFFSTGNQFALCSEVVSPQLKSTINGLTGVMINLGGIVGNTLISSLIQNNIGMISVSITIVLSIWLVGSVFWLLPYFYYSKDKVSKEIVTENHIIQVVV